MITTNKYLFWAIFWTVEAFLTLGRLIEGEPPTPFDALFPLMVSSCNYWYFWIMKRKKEKEKAEDLEDLWEDK